MYCLQRWGQSNCDNTNITTEQEKKTGAGEKVGQWKRLCKRNQNHNIHYMKIHDYNIDYDIICAHHGGFKIQNFLLGTKLPTSRHVMANHYLNAWFNCHRKFYLQANNVYVLFEHAAKRTLWETLSRVAVWQLSVVSNWRHRKTNLWRIKNYRKVTKRYKKALTAMRYTAIRLGFLSAALSTAGVALSLTCPGIIVSAPLGALGAFCGAGSALLTNLSKKLSLEVSKHERIYSLPNTIPLMLVSKTLNLSIIIDFVTSGKTSESD